MQWQCGTKNSTIAIVRLSGPCSGCRELTLRPYGGRCPYAGRSVNLPETDRRVEPDTFTITINTPVRSETGSAMA